MRETRLYGSEGGEAKAFPTPIVFRFVWIFQRANRLFVIFKNNLYERRQEWQIK